MGSPKSLQQHAIHCVDQSSCKPTFSVETEGPQFHSLQTIGIYGAPYLYRYAVLRHFHEWQVHRYYLLHNAPAQVVGIDRLSSGFRWHNWICTRSVRKLTQNTHDGIFERNRNRLYRWARNKIRGKLIPKWNNIYKKREFKRCSLDQWNEKCFVMVETGGRWRMRDELGWRNTGFVR